MERSMIIIHLISFVSLGLLVTHIISGDDTFLHLGAGLLFGSVFIHIIGTFLYGLIVTLLENREKKES